jgi:hypothetical protein
MTLDDIRRAVRRAIARRGPELLKRQSFAKRDESLTAIYAAALKAVIGAVDQVTDAACRLRLLRIAGALLLAEFKAWPLCPEPELQHLQGAIAALGAAGDNRLTWHFEDAGARLVSNRWAEGSNTGSMTIEQLEVAFLPPAAQQIERWDEWKAFHARTGITAAKLARAVRINRASFYTRWLNSSIWGDDCDEARRIRAFYANSLGSETVSEKEKHFRAVNETSVSGIFET